MILITGCAGFIGYHLSKKLLQENYKIIGFDNLNNYYDTKLKNLGWSTTKIFDEEIEKIVNFYKNNFIW